MENENFAHMEPSKEMLGLQNLENSKRLFSLSGRPVPTENESLENWRKFNEEIELRMFNYRRDLGSGNYEKMMNEDDVNRIPVTEKDLEKLSHWNEPTKPYNWGDKLSEEKLEEVIKEYLPEEKPKVATGRKAGKDNKTPLESLKVHHHKIKLQEKMDTSKIIHEQKNTNHAMYCNTAVVYLNPGGKHFLEEAYLQEGLRKIQGFRK